MAQLKLRFWTIPTNKKETKWDMRLYLSQYVQSTHLLEQKKHPYKEMLFTLNWLYAATLISLYRRRIHNERYQTVFSL